MSNFDSINVSINLKKVNAHISNCIENIKDQKNYYKSKIRNIHSKEKLLMQRFEELKEYENEIKKKNTQVKNNLTKFRNDYQKKTNNLNQESENYVHLYQEVMDIQNQNRKREQFFSEQIISLQNKLNLAISALKSSQNTSRQVQSPNKSEIEISKNNLRSLKILIKNLSQKRTDVEKNIKEIEMNIQEFNDKIESIASFLQNEESKYALLKDQKFQIIEAQRNIYKSTTHRFEENIIMSSLSSGIGEMSPDEYRKSLAFLKQKLESLKSVCANIYSELEKKKQQIYSQIAILQNYNIETSAINSANMNNKDAATNKDENKLEHALSLKYQISKYTAEIRDISGKLSKEKSIFQSKKAELKDILENYQNYLDVIDRYYEEKYAEKHNLEKYADLKVAPSLEQKIKINDAIFEPDTSYKRFEKEVKYEEGEVKKLKLEMFENEKQNENLFKQVKTINNRKLIGDMEEMKKRNSFELLQQRVHENKESLNLKRSKIENKFWISAVAQLDLLSSLVTEENVKMQKRPQYEKDNSSDWMNTISVLEKTFKNEK